jgi:hypothetical protein
MNEKHVAPPPLTSLTEVHIPLSVALPEQLPIEQALKETENLVKATNTDNAKTDAENAKTDAENAKTDAEAHAEPRDFARVAGDLAATINSLTKP